MINIPLQFKPTINTVYPYENFIEFERWFGDNYNLNLEREYLGVYWCGYQVNHNYGNDFEAMRLLQEFVDLLPRDKKYFTISQYDDSVGVDFKDLDVLVFNMSKNGGYPIPLLCQPNSFRSNSQKNIFASFIGKHTHPIREHIFSLRGKDGYYITDKDTNINEYCEMLANSFFALSPRGYGLASFRCYEAMQYNTIPVYISDEHILPYNLDFNEFGVLIQEKDAHRIDEILSLVTPQQIVQKQDKLKELYESHFTYQGCFNQIVKVLKDESSNNT